jgi:TRAP-type C4-dicarboxylate transport system substrate-binding protein
MKRRQALIIGMAAMHQAGADSTPSWKIASGYRADSFHGQNLQKFSQEVESATGGALKVELRSGDAPAALPMEQIPEALLRGQLQGGEVILTGLVKEIPIAGADVVPFVVQSYEDARRLWQHQRPLLEQHLARRGLQVLYAVPWPPQGLYSTRPVASIQDLRGVRMRTYNATTERIAQLTGAQAVRVPMAEVSQALAGGTIDTMITSAVTGVENRVWDRVKFYYDIKAWFPKNIVLASQAALDALAPRQREAVLEAARQAEPRGWSACEVAARESLDELRRHGMRVELPTPQLRRDLRRLGERFSLEWLRNVGQEANAIFIPYYRQAT